MQIYLFIIIAFGFYAVLSYLTKNKKVFIFLASIHLFVVQGFRAITVGEDLGRYSAYYNVLEGAPYEYVWNSSLETGYQLISHTLVNLGLDFHGFLLLISAFSLIAFALLVDKYSPNPFIPYIFYLVFGLYDFGFSGLRQVIAMAIFFLAIPYLVEKNFFKYFIAILIASTVHTTAIILLIPYIIINFRINSYYKRYYWFIVLIFILLSRQLSNLLTVIFNDSLLRYTEGASGFGFGDLLLWLIFIFSIFISKKDIRIKKDNIFGLLQMICSLAIIIQIISMNSYMFVRLNLYFYGLVAIFMAHLYEKSKTFLSAENKFQFVTIDFVGTIVLTLVAVLFYYIYLQANPHSIVPHSFY
ncbi:EpsG family protein [Aerococcus sp. L_4]